VLCERPGWQQALDRKRDAQKGGAGVRPAERTTALPPQPPKTTTTTSAAVSGLGLAAQEGRGAAGTRSASGGSAATRPPPPPRPGVVGVLLGVAARGGQQLRHALVQQGLCSLGGQNGCVCWRCLVGRGVQTVCVCGMSIQGRMCEERVGRARDSRSSGNREQAAQQLQRRPAENSSKFSVASRRRTLSASTARRAGPQCNARLPGGRRRESKPRRTLRPPSGSA
jgi:hypothetical protein